MHRHRAHGRVRLSAAAASSKTAGSTGTCAESSSETVDRSYTCARAHTHTHTGCVRTYTVFSMALKPVRDMK